MLRKSPELSGSTFSLYKAFPLSAPRSRCVMKCSSSAAEARACCWWGAGEMVTVFWETLRFLKATCGVHLCGLHVLLCSGGAVLHCWAGAPPPSGATPRVTGGMCGTLQHGKCRNMSGEPEVGGKRHWRKEFHLLWKRFKIQNFIAKMSQFLPPPHPRVLMLGVEWKSKLSKWLQKHCLAEKSNFIPKLCLTEKCILTLVWRLAVPSQMYLSAYTFPLRNKREKDEQSPDLSPGKNTTVCCWCTSVQTSLPLGKKEERWKRYPWKQIMIWVFPGTCSCTGGWRMSLRA